MGGPRFGWLTPAALLLCVVNFALFYPGAMDNDALNQYREARTGAFTDWHPPIMAYVWSWMLRLVDGPQGMLALQLGLHWMGFWAVSNGLARQGRSWAAGLMLAAGLFPLFPVFNGEVLKDVQMASAWIAAFGFAFRRRALGIRWGWPALLLVSLLLGYGLLLRTNAVFAFGPLLVYFATGTRRLSTPRLVVAALAIAMVSIPLSAAFNRVVLGAASSGSIGSLQLFDLAGIAQHSGDATGFTEATGLGMEVVERCHTSYWWDGFSSWGRCREASKDWGAAADETRPGLTGVWLRSIAAHPGAYVEHRLRHLNSSLLFLVPAKHARFAESKTSAEPVETPATTTRLIAVDLVAKNFVLWPITWVVLGLFTILLLEKRGAVQTDGAWAAKLLVMSALMYSLAYGAIGVATGLRYHYWSAMALLTAWLIAAPSLLALMRIHRALTVAGALLLLGVIAAGFTFRILDVQAFL